jgi:ribonuclease BN (tRNA processing enzyme)
VRLTVLGCWSGGVPPPGGRASGFLIEAAGAKVLLDCGNGVLGALSRYAAIEDLAAVVVSHAHFDHVGDLHPLALYLRYRKPARKLPLFGPPGIRTLLYRWFTLFSNVPDDYVQNFAITEFRPWTPVKAGTLDIMPFPVEHNTPAFGVKVESEGRTFAYSGDTKESALLEEAAQGADVLLCEATYADGASESQLAAHMTGAQAGALAKRAGVRRLLLTHFLITQDPSLIALEASAAFGKTVERADLLAEKGSVDL